jgi:hypothetical protein
MGVAGKTALGFDIYIIKETRQGKRHKNHNRNDGYGGYNNGYLRSVIFDAF